MRHIGEGGRVVLTSSVSARRSFLHHTLYASSKAAVEAMVLNLAPELGAKGITINAIAPGGTATDMATGAAPHYFPGQASRGRRRSYRPDPAGRRPLRHDCVFRECKE